MLAHNSQYVMECEFYDKYYNTFGQRNGKFRGKGQIKILDHAIELYGKRVYPLAVRICLGLAIIAITEIVAAILEGSFEIDDDILMFSALIAVYATEAIILKSEYLKIDWNLINKYVIDEKKKMIGFTFSGESALNPIVLGGKSFETLSEVFRKKMPKNEHEIERYFSSPFKN